jgi:two-component system, sensor histidine kinase PhcS
MATFSPILPTSSRHTPDPDGLSAFAVKLMQAEDRRFTLRNLRLMAMVGAGMVAFFAVLDHFAYPEFVALFAALRWTFASLILVLLMMVRSKFGKRHFRLFTLVLPLIPALFVVITVFTTKDPATEYYAGLSLCIVAIGFLFHWTYREALIVSITVLFMYLGACVPAINDGMTPRTWAGLFSNLVFLVATGAVVVAGSLAHHRARVEEFKGRERLRQKRLALRNNALALEQTLRNLEETEGQLIQSGKMASLGQLSASVIHEIGNPLNHSNQALFLLRRRLKQQPEDEIINEAVIDIQDSIDRMKDIVRDLREFSHKRSELLISFPVLESIEVATRMLGKEIADTATVVDVEIDSGVRIEGVKNQISQVFINLIHNAIQAMDKAGTVHPRRIVISVVGNDPAVILSIRDNGPGIPEEVRKQVFEPFFTTKEVGEGTGLGLSICFRIIEAHRGTIQVLSDGHSYTEFRISLPQPVDPEHAETPDPATHHPIPQPTLSHEHAIH